MTPRFHLFLVALAFGSGCSGSTDDACVNSTPATLKDLQASVFTPSCATGGCHRGAAPAQGLDLSEGKAFGALSGKKSALEPSRLLVESRQPSESELYLQVHSKLMPANGVLTEAQIQKVSDWICAGALDN